MARISRNRTTDDLSVLDWAGRTWRSTTAICVLELRAVTSLAVCWHASSRPPPRNNRHRGPCESGLAGLPPGQHKVMMEWITVPETVTFALKGDTMKKGYWVVAYRSISDELALKAYGALALPAIESFGGRVLTTSTSQIQAHEAGLPLRTIVVEFDSYDIALAAHKSAAYEKALQAFGSGAERDFRIVEGA